LPTTVEGQSRDHTSITAKIQIGASLLPDDRFDFVCLKLHHREFFYFSVVETTAPDPGSFQPAMDCIPGDSLTRANGRLVQTLDTERRDFIEGSATVLKSIIGCPGRRVECLPTSWALVATTLPPLSLVETVTDNASCNEFSRP
jgi:hypothetical protein